MSEKFTLTLEIQEGETFMHSLEVSKTEGERMDIRVEGNATKLAARLEMALAHLKEKIESIKAGT